MADALRVHVELAIVEKMDAAQARLDRGFENVPRVPQPVHVADFVPVKGRDRQFHDPQFLEDKLNDDLGVEMEIVRVFLERNLREGRGGIEPVTGVKLGQLRAEHPVLEPGQDLVADPFVGRHSAAARRPFVDHARAEHRIRFVARERREQLRQFLRRILSVAMHKRDDVETVVDCVAVAEFLIAALTLVSLSAQDSDLEGGVSLLITQTIDEGVGLRRIVDDQDFDVLALQGTRNAIENLLNRRRRIVGNDKNQQPLATEIDSSGF